MKNFEKKINASFYQDLKLFLVPLLILIFLFFGIIIYSEWPLYFDLSRKGLKNFIEIFEPAINISSVISIILGLLLTIKRMEQTNRQIELIEENNRFSNYYKHREEFIKYILEIPIIKDYLAFNEREKIDIISIYNYFYYKSFKVFKPKINISKKNEIDHFLNLVKSSSLNQKGITIDDIQDTEIQLILNSIPANLKSFPIRIKEGLYKLLIEEGKERFKKNGGYKTILEKFFNLYSIYYYLCLINSVLFFDDENSDKIEFYINFENYEKEFNFNKVKQNKLDTLLNG